MKAIILAAGLGKRLRPLTAHVPKCLIKIHHESIIRNAIRMLAKYRVQDTVVVVGYKADKVRAALGTLYGRMTIIYVENPLYGQTNTSYSLWLALKESSIPGDLLLMEGDVFFQGELLRKLIEAPERNLAVVEKYRPGLDGSMVELDRLNHVVDWWHESQRHEDFVVQTKYKTVNMYKFERSFLVDALIPVLNRRIESTGGTEPLEYSMKEIVRSDPSAISACVAQGLKWAEIDDENDLRRAERIFASGHMEAPYDA